MNTSLARQNSDEIPTELMGFQPNPLKFFTTAIAWRVIAWSLLQGLSMVPLLISCILLAPFLPKVYYEVDRLQRHGAAWLGVVIPQQITRRKRWLDAKQGWVLAGHLGVSFVALLVSATAMPLIVVVFFTPFFLPFAPPGAGVHLGFWSTESVPLVTLISWIFGLCALLMSLYTSWGLAATSVRITTVANRNSDEEIQQLTQSRATLIDAFTGERRRIERELHDGVQQYLTALQLNIATVELATAQYPEAHAEILEPLHQAKANTHQALVALRATVRGIYPQVLADKGIVEALQELVAHSGVAGELNVSTKNATLLTPTEALLLYHCSAEGITNAVKHGHATKVRLVLADVPAGIQLSIHDNGVGEFTTETAGTGIAGLRERAQALGGTIGLQQSSDLPGAQLTMLIPLSLESTGVVE